MPVVPSCTSTLSRAWQEQRVITTRFCRAACKPSRICSRPRAFQQKRSATFSQHEGAVETGDFSRVNQRENLKKDADSSTAVIIVDHGSRREASNQMLFEFVSMYRQSSNRLVVEGAHMEIAGPSIADAVQKCAEAGAKRIIIAPYFLSHGRHIQDDIPALVQAAQQNHEGVECVVAEPIGLDPLMAQLIEARVQRAALTAHHDHP